VTLILKKLLGQTSQVQPLILIYVVSFLNSVDDLFLFQHVNKPTRIREGNSPSRLDLVFTNEEDRITNLLYLPPLGNSDHVCIQIDLLCYLEFKKTDNNVRYNTREANIDQMKQSLSDVDWIFLIDPLDVSDAWLQFKSVFQDALNNCGPIYKPKKKKSLYSNSEVFSLKGRRINFGRSISHIILLKTLQILNH